MRCQARHVLYTFNIVASTQSIHTWHTSIHTCIHAWNSSHLLRNSCTFTLIHWYYTYTDITLILILHLYWYYTYTDITLILIYSCTFTLILICTYTSILKSSHMHTYTCTHTCIYDATHSSGNSSTLLLFMAAPFAAPSSRGRTPGGIVTECGTEFGGEKISVYGSMYVCVCLCVDWIFFVVRKCTCMHVCQGGHTHKHACVSGRAYTQATTLKWSNKTCISIIHVFSGLFRCAHMRACTCICTGAS
jgi:hypothetical protein